MKEHRLMVIFGIQFAKCQEFANVQAPEVFERKILLSVSNSEKIFKTDILSSDSVSNSATYSAFGFLWLYYFLLLNVLLKSIFWLFS